MVTRLSFFFLRGEVEPAWAGTLPLSSLERPTSEFPALVARSDDTDSGEKGRVIAGGSAHECEHVRLSVRNLE